MRLRIEAELDYWIDGAADVLLQLEVAAMADQRLLSHSLDVWCDGPLAAVEGEESIGQRTWAHAVGGIRAHYRAEVEIVRAGIDLAALPGVPPRALPGMTVPYLLSSRYCEAEKFESYVTRRFGHLSGGAQVLAIVEWVRSEVAYESGSSGGEASALTTFVERRGVCRDFAHLVVAMCRAAGVPARCVSAYAPGVDPPDFHAVAEVWLDGGWHLVDATGMASCDDLARVVVGRDATDIAFMTIFGVGQLRRQEVRVTRLAPEQAPAPSVFVGQSQE